VRVLATWGDGADIASFRLLIEGATVVAVGVLLALRVEVKGGLACVDPRALSEGPGAATWVTMICSPRVMGIADR
jgi:hypothetical protein